jgi:transglutaminase-like putative cysteine protease
MKFSLGCELTYRVAASTPFVFNVQAQEFDGQVVHTENLDITPNIGFEEWTMPESGNRYLRVVAQPGELTVRYEATASLTPAAEDPLSIRLVTPEDLPLWVLPHLYPSRYCQSDRLERMAQRTFGHLTGYAKVNGICNWICDNVDYERGSSDALTSAFDTVSQRSGVCRDFAHLAIAFCRAQLIPARYVSAYAWRLFPADFHAIFEAFLEGPQGRGWYLFDPTRMSAPDGLVRIGVGRDAAEVAFCSPYGEMKAGKPKVWIKPISAAPEVVTTQAIRPQLSWLTGPAITPKAAA